MMKSKMLSCVGPSIKGRAEDKAVTLIGRRRKRMSGMRAWFHGFAQLRVSVP